MHDCRTARRREFSAKIMHFSAVIYAKMKPKLQSRARLIDA